MLVEALADCDSALYLFPRYTKALFQRALVLLDQSKPDRALLALEVLLFVDRKWPGIGDWMVRAYVRQRRLGMPVVVADGFHVGDTVRTREALEGYWAPGDVGEIVGLGSVSGPIHLKLPGDRRYYVHAFHVELAGKPQLGSPTAPESAGEHYATLGLCVDFSPDELKKAYRDASRRLHPDKPGGSTEGFQRAAAANEVLSDVNKRHLYDLGAGLVPPEHGEEDGEQIRKEIEQRYFPEAAGFQLFGDPHERKKERIQRRREEQQREREMRRQQEEQARAEMLRIQQLESRVEEMQAEDAKETAHRRENEEHANSEYDRIQELERKIREMEAEDAAEEQRLQKIREMRPDTTTGGTCGADGATDDCDAGAGES